MKKIYSLIMAMCAFGLSASAAAVHNQTTSADYDDLGAAVDAAADGDVLLLNENVSVNSRIGVGGKAVTIKGNAEGVTITRATAGDAMIFLCNNSGTLNFENIIIDGNNVEGKANAMESSNKATVGLTNVTFKNYVTTSNQGLLSCKNSGKANINGVTVVNCTVPDGRGDIFVGSNGSTISGNNSVSLYIEKALKIKAENVANTTPVTIYMDATRAVNLVIVEGCNDVKQFVAGGDIFKLKAEGANLIAIDKSTPETLDPVVNETTGAGYTSLINAFNEAASGDVLLVNEDQTVNGSRLNSNDRDITIKGNAEGVKITCGMAANTIMFLVNNAKGVLRFENLIIDGNGATRSISMLGAHTSGSNLYLTNVTIQNVTQDGNTPVEIKGGGKMHVNGLVVKDCAVKGDRGNVFVGSGGSTIAGNNSFILGLEDNTINAPEAANAEPLKVLLMSWKKQWAAGMTAIIGCDDPNQFTCTNEGLKLVAGEGENAGNLVVADDDSTAIDAIDADETDAPVEYFNLQGMPVSAATLRAGQIYIRRCGSTVSKIRY